MSAPHHVQVFVVRWRHDSAPYAGQFTSREYRGRQRAEAFADKLRGRGLVDVEVWGAITDWRLLA